MPHPDYLTRCLSEIPSEEDDLPETPFPQRNGKKRSKGTSVRNTKKPRQREVRLRFQFPLLEKEPDQEDIDWSKWEDNDPYDYWGGPDNVDPVLINLHDNDDSDDDYGRYEYRPCRGFSLSFQHGCIVGLYSCRPTPPFIPILSPIPSPVAQGAGD